MRRFIIATNEKIEQLDNVKVIAMNIEDLQAIFNQDVLNVLNQKQYDELKKSKYMYGLEVEFENYLTGYRSLLHSLYQLMPNLICIFDVSIKRYINNAEFKYFANNKLLPSKLFNIEIESSGNSCVYTTIGLASIGLKEFRFSSELYLNEEDFQIFKGVVTNYIIGKVATVNINLSKVDYSIIDSGQYLEFKYQRPKRIYEFYIRDDQYLNKIRYDLIKYNWDVFLRLEAKQPQLGNYVVNKSPVRALNDFDVAHVEEFTIVCEDINYNQDNLFYAYKYL